RMIDYDTPNTCMDFNYENRLKNVKTITKKNCDIIKRIVAQGQESNYSMRVQECDYKRSQEYSRLYSKYLHNAVKEAEKKSATLQYSLLNQAQLSLMMPKHVCHSNSCFLDVKVEDGFPLGRMIIELYSDHVPKTTLNFLSLCKGDSGMSYQNSPFHCILPPLLCQTGDVVRFDGHGGMSIYGDTFPDENFDLKHVGPGILSMVSVGPNTNNSKFNISFKQIITLNNKCVVFGRLVKGFKTLQKGGAETIRRSMLRKVMENVLRFVWRPVELT
ncbi:unnamed protein product, partial [Timema podura]|nr:unnamed protein product [Timema podura]